MEILSRLFSFLGYSAGVFVGTAILPGFFALVGLLVGNIMRKVSDGRFPGATRVGVWTGFVLGTLLLEWAMVTDEVIGSLGRGLHSWGEYGAATGLLVSRSLTAAVAGAILGLSFRFVRMARRAVPVAGVVAGAAFAGLTFVLGAVLGSLLAPGSPGPDGALMAFFFAGTIGVATHVRPRSSE